MEAVASARFLANPHAKLPAQLVTKFALGKQIKALFQGLYLAIRKSRLGYN